MKNSITTLCIILLSIMLLTTSCDRELPFCSNCTPPPPPPPTANSPIWVNALMDITIELPMSNAMLIGELAGPESNGARIRWQQLSGPSASLIDKPDSLITKVSNLVLGNYRFSITATSVSGETKTDELIVNVQNATSSDRQIIFSSLNWVCPLMGCGIWLGYVSPNYFAENAPISLYIKREGAQHWDRVVPDSVFRSERYYYSRYDGQLSVSEFWTNEATDHPEIKIVF